MLKKKELKIYDVIIVGGGPGGLTAAVYQSRSGNSVAIIEKGMYGGQLLNTDLVENYGGITTISGTELAMQFDEQARSLDNVDHIFGNIKTAYKEDDLFVVETRKKKYIGKTLIIATGVTHKKMGLDGEKIYEGNGISYCATCDGAFYRGKNVTVIGGGDSALESAIYLSKIASSVTIMHRRDEFRAEQILQDRANEIENIKYIMNSEVTSIWGDDDTVTDIGYKDKTGLKNELHSTEGVFVNIGVIPNADPFGDLGILRESGYIYTTETVKTSVEGVFAVGDIRYNSIRQIVTATGDGAIASDQVNKYLQKENK